MNLTQKFALEVAREKLRRYETEGAWDALSHDFGGSYEALINPQAIAECKHQRDAMAKVLHWIGNQNPDAYEDFIRECRKRARDVLSLGASA